jgi:formylglycine-generating enzyme required for sulfatase activity
MPAIIIFVILFLVGIYQYWSQPINIHYPEKTFKKIQTMAPDINMPFVWIPEGCFKNPETTCLNGFWMSKHEVTQNQWNIIMKYNPAFHEDSENQLPVESVSWKQINQFIQALNQEQGHDFALPTGIQ